MCCGTTGNYCCCVARVENLGRELVCLACTSGRRTAAEARGIRSCRFARPSRTQCTVPTGALWSDFFCRNSQEFYINLEIKLSQPIVNSTPHSGLRRLVFDGAKDAALHSGRHPQSAPRLNSTRVLLRRTAPILRSFMSQKHRPITTHG